MTRWLRRLRFAAHRLKKEIYALYIAIRDPETPWYVKGLGAVIIGYAISPIDLIPDFIPILGLVDDLLLLPAAIALLIRLVPVQVMIRSRERANAQRSGNTLISRKAAVVIVLLWVCSAGLLGWWIHGVFFNNP